MKNNNRWFIGLVNQYDDDIKKIEYDNIADIIAAFTMYYYDDMKGYVFDRALDRVIINYDGIEIDDPLELI